MDEPANRFARELIDAISAAAAHDPEVQACRARARAAGLELSVTIEAQVGMSDKSQAQRSRAVVVPPARRLPATAPRAYDITAADRRFLRSLRIAADETTESV